MLVNSAFDSKYFLFNEEGSFQRIAHIFALSISECTAILKKTSIVIDLSHTLIGINRILNLLCVFKGSPCQQTKGGAHVSMHMCTMCMKTLKCPVCASGMKSVQIPN